MWWLHGDRRDLDLGGTTFITTEEGDGHAAGDIEADPIDRDPPFGDGPPVYARRHVGAALIQVDAVARSIATQGGTHRRIEVGQGLRKDVGGDREPGRADPVEALPQLIEGVGAAVSHLGAQRGDNTEGRVDVEFGAGKGRPQLRRGERPTSQVQPTDHGRDSRLPRPPDRCRFRHRRRG